MIKNGEKITPFFIAMTIVFTVTAAIILLAVFAGENKLNFKACFYFICLTSREDSLSASAFSGGAESLGGAGYVLEYDGEFYVTVACYYDKNDAERVKKSLLNRGANCFILKVEKDEYPIKSIVSGEKKEQFCGVLNTLLDVSKTCYECANGLDGGNYSQQSAKALLSDVKGCLKNLKDANADNCFFEEIKRLLSECESAESGYIYSKNLRKLQIAIADAIINAELY